MGSCVSSPKQVTPPNREINLIKERIFKVRLEDISKEIMRVQEIISLSEQRGAMEILALSTRRKLELQANYLATKTNLMLCQSAVELQNLDIQIEDISNEEINAIISGIPPNEV